MSSTQDSPFFFEQKWYMSPWHNRQSYNLIDNEIFESMVVEQMSKTNEEVTASQYRKKSFKLKKQLKENQKNQ